MPVTRLIAVEDGPVVAELLRRDADFFAPSFPEMTPERVDVDGVTAGIGRLLAQHAEGLALPQVILDGERVVGRVTVTNVIRGAAQYGFLGYWVARSANGRGLATRAVGAIAEEAFEGLGLHRLQAETQVDNVRSQRVLQRNGFERIGLAPQLLRIAGRWQDHLLWQRLAPG